MPKITFIKGKSKKTVDVESGANLRKEAMKAGVDVYSGIHKYVHCPGLGLCTTCRVNVTKGEENCRKPSIWERLGLTGIFMPLTFFARIGNEKTMRLSCQTKVEGDCEVETTPDVNWHGEKYWS